MQLFIDAAADTAQQKWGISKVKTIVGEFYLINSASDFLIDFFKSKGIFEIYPCHRTDLNAKIALACGGIKSS